MRTSALDRQAVIDRLSRLGIALNDAQELRRISLTLRRWFENECGTEHGSIERDETTGKPMWRSAYGSNSRIKIADKETGARIRLSNLMKAYPHLTVYIQTDPRGCSLYILTPDQLEYNLPVEQIYSRGVAVY